MKELREFEIGIFKIKPGLHHYHYSIDDSFFKAFENSPVKYAKGEIGLELEKAETMITLDFVIKGTVELTCDRSLEPFDQPIELHEKLIMKFGEEDEELSDEISTINWKTETINVAQYIYEFIGLAIPMRKIHPKLRDIANEGEDIIYSTSGNKRRETFDPRWNALKNLKNNRKD